MKAFYHKSLWTLFLILLPYLGWSQGEHPNLVLTAKGVEDLRTNLGKYPLLDKTFNKVKTRVLQALDEEINIPIPKDPGGGYTHEVHKQNYKKMYEAGLLYQIEQNDAYAEYVKKQLLGYAAMYPSLGLHPERKSSNPGVLFWQGLNDSVWLVYVSQAYDCVYDYLTKKERKEIEKNLFRPIVKFFSEQNVVNFDKVHNHGTWMVAGVGMISYVMGDEEMVQKTLKGSKLDGQSGFLKQLDELFSPDGYYTEGPYYQRYALMPFILYAHTLSHRNPELGIYEYRNGVLPKAVEAVLQLSYTNGRFFPINDALKEKTYNTAELVYGVDIAFTHFGQDAGLLSIAEEQGELMLGEEGVAVAKAIAEGKAKPFNYRSLELSDGSEGKNGGLGILRDGDQKDQLCLLMKYSSSGMGHGHFDKLSFSLYDKGVEVLQDYGAVRFLNTVQKQGGRYLPENKTWAKQTVSHNTVVVDAQSNYKGKQKVADKLNSEMFFTVFEDPKVQIISALDTTAYEGVKMQRTMAMISKGEHQKPWIIDLFRVNAEEEHQYDLPFYYMGHKIDSNIPFKIHSNQWNTMGDDHGYQHLWNMAEGNAASHLASFTWLQNERFYTLTSVANTETKYFMTQLGANDPEVNLRKDSGFMIRQPKAKAHTFLSVIEAHGEFNPNAEYTVNSESQLKDLKLLADTEEGSVVMLEDNSSQRWVLMIANQDAAKESKHTVTANGKTYEWVGPYQLQEMTSEL
ncbi:alginate lyase family protein [Sediminitomix flava]|uniref:Alginate lyase n=1 Tax=Sediminitomix flava TaxID=379075 RepID=A0A315ZHR0_SEDFL|nr:alginate lyase family protein [Sediminitomix flava]PWJ44753.1 alginate lyase [Sediminitomix flava]